MQVILIISLLLRKVSWNNAPRQRLVLQYLPNCFIHSISRFLNDFAVLYVNSNFLYLASRLKTFFPQLQDEYSFVILSAIPPSLALKNKIIQLKLKVNITILQRYIIRLTCLSNCAAVCSTRCHFLISTLCKLSCCCNKCIQSSSVFGVLLKIERSIVDS